MASVAKFRLVDAPRLLSHCNRTQRNPGQHIHKERTPLNFNLADGHGSLTDYQFARGRVYDKNVKMMKRDDVKAVCSWAVTYPKEMCHQEIGPDNEEYYAPNDPDECREFFTHAYNFFKDRHGEENVVSAYVHMDENMPHMHFIFVPIVRAKDDRSFKVCAKEALHGCFGAKFQIELQDYISQNMNKEVHMVRQETVDYERNVRELKKKTLNQKCADLAKQISRSEEQLERNLTALAAVSKAAEGAKEAKIKVTSHNGFTVMRDEDWRNIQRQMKEINALRAERREVRRALEEFRDANKERENQELRKQNDELLKDNDQMKNELAELKGFMYGTKIKGRTLMEVYKEVNKKRQHQHRQFMQYMDHARR